MKSTETPSEFQKFDALVKRVIAVPHSEVQARMKEWKKRKERKRKKRTAKA
jgi:hypothetical protein